MKRPPRLAQGRVQGSGPLFDSFPEPLEKTALVFPRLTSSRDDAEIASIPWNLRVGDQKNLFRKKLQLLVL